MSNKKSVKPVVKLTHPSYQPSKAELGEDMRIDATPEEIAKAIGRQVEVRYSKPSEKRNKPSNS